MDVALCHCLENSNKDRQPADDSQKMSSLIFSKKSRKMAQDMSSGAVVIGASQVKQKISA